MWQLAASDESTFSTILPIEDAKTERKSPWLLHSLTVNALNFCSFAMCQSPRILSAKSPGESTQHLCETIIAVPGINDGFINVTSLPNEERVATIPPPKDIKTGMVMAIGLHYHENELVVLAGYESGYTCVWRQMAASPQWQAIYSHNAHSQPILSLDIAPAMGCFFTSSADAVVARHSLLQAGGKFGGTKVQQTKHAGQQSLTVRSDEKIFATAGWDGRARVYSATMMKELAVLKWHKEGCYALAFAELTTKDEGNDETTVLAKQESVDSVAKRELTVSERRTEKSKFTHWLAAGSKDGNVSLWEIY